jgi:hypothetical protein
MGQVVLVGAFFAAGALVSFLLRERRAPRWPPRVNARYCVYAGVSVIALVALGFDIINNVWGDQKQWQITIFLGSMLIAAGWVVTNEVTIRNSRKQHTINLITTLMTNQKRIEDKEKIREKLPRSQRLNRTILDYDAENDPLAQAIDRELNFYEFIAIGLATGDLDENIARRMLDGLLTNCVWQVEDYILHWRSKNKTTWEDVSELYKRWARPQ